VKSSKENVRGENTPAHSRYLLLGEVVNSVDKSLWTQNLATIEMHATNNVSKAVRVTVCLSLVNLFSSSNR
jgi:hypothetical protein